MSEVSFAFSCGGGEKTREREEGGRERKRGFCNGFLLLAQVRTAYRRGSGRDRGGEEEGGGGGGRRDY